MCINTIIREPHSTTVVHTIEVTNASITIFEGQPIHLECYPQPILAQIRWTFNDNDLTDGDNDRISLQPDELHHQLFINNSVAADSGVYICYVDTDVGRLTFINTTLTVIPGMRETVARYNCIYASTSIYDYLKLILHMLFYMLYAY